MKRFLTQSIAAAALICAGSAHADVIDFENLGDQSAHAPYGYLNGTSWGGLMADGDYVTQGNYFINTQDANNGGGLVGQWSNGSDPTSCLDGVCPTGNTTGFLSVFDDGLVHVGNNSGTSVLFSSAQVAFLKASGDAVGTTGMYMAVEADRADGYAVWAVPVTGVGSFVNLTATAAGGLVGGQLLGSTGASSSLTAAGVTDLFFYAYYCNPTSGSCSAFKTNKGQFAIDNIALDVTAVPEPSQWLLMLAGLGAVGAIARRRRAV